MRNMWQPRIINQCKIIICSLHSHTSNSDISSSVMFKRECEKCKKYKKRAKKTVNDFKLHLNVIKRIKRHHGLASEIYVFLKPNNISHVQNKFQFVGMPGYLWRCGTFSHSLKSISCSFLPLHSWNYIYIYVLHYLILVSSPSTLYYYFNTCISRSHSQSLTLTFFFAAAAAWLLLGTKVFMTTRKNLQLSFGNWNWIKSIHKCS
jgi:hypothetical protein